ncbi:hypothetical protein [Novosphingobium huizhouense]|uniref:hypothetical protein n=1 Tax=Novosphingobium huizhouense TaxID=2866625 RepID=UPI001CD904A3|nr:hypothetical protein [Novosphingobium huizhouense]
MIVALILAQAAAPTADAAELRSAVAQVTATTRTWFDCAWQAAPALSANGTDSAETLAAAAVDGCIDEQRATEAAQARLGALTGLPWSESRKAFEAARTAQIRGIAAQLVRMRATAQQGKR